MHVVHTQGKATLLQNGQVLISGANSGAICDYGQLVANTTSYRTWLLTSG